MSIPTRVKRTRRVLAKELYGRYRDKINPGAFMTALVPSKSERIDVRASLPVKQLLQEAARVAHKNVSEFLLPVMMLA